MPERLPCQVCGRKLVPLSDGTSRKHFSRRGPHDYDDDYCQGAGYRLARWPVGQRLRHYMGSVWRVERDRGGRYGDYELRCVVGTRALDGDRWLEQPGRTLIAHGEYMHRHGWTPVKAGEETR